MEIIIVPSLVEPNVFFLFREISNNNYLEIKLRINAKKQTLKTSKILNPNEMEFIRENIFVHKNLEKMMSDEEYNNLRYFSRSTVNYTKHD